MLHLAKYLNVNANNNNTQPADIGAYQYDTGNTDNNINAIKANVPNI